METPEWGSICAASSSGCSSSSGGSEKDKGAAPKSWKGRGEWQVLTTGLLTCREVSCTSQCLKALWGTQFAAVSLGVAEHWHIGAAASSAFAAANHIGAMWGRQCALCHSGSDAALTVF